MLSGFNINYSVSIGAFVHFARLICQYIFAPLWPQTRQQTKTVNLFYQKRNEKIENYVIFFVKNIMVLYARPINFNSFAIAEHIIVDQPNWIGGWRENGVSEWKGRYTGTIS